jgi:hypothetical protein
MAIQIIATTQYKSQYQKYLAKPDKTGRRYPVVSKILMRIVNDFLFHFYFLFALQK